MATIKVRLCLVHSSVNDVLQFLLILNVQEAQLSQRDRAMFRVIEYLAKSYKVIRNDIQLEYGLSLVSL